MRIALRSTVASLILALALAGSVWPAPSAAAGGYVPADETRVGDMVNATRSGKGLGKLTRVAGLVDMAREQADRMEAKGNIFHNTDLGGDITSRGLQWLRVGENVGMGPNVDLIQQAFLDSPGHYANIIKPEYDAMGIGVVDGDDGKRYVVQVFANLKVFPSVGPATDPAPAPAAPAPKPAGQPVASTPKPAPPTPKPVLRTPQPTLAPTPVPRPSVRPNALTSGYVRPLELPLAALTAETPSDLGRRASEAPMTTPSVWDRLYDIIAFWA